MTEQQCRPEICPMPSPSGYPTGALWSCPRCRAVYRRKRPVRERWWRNWYAPVGYWKFTGRHA